MAAIPRHKVFLSYHHANDQSYRKAIQRALGDGVVSRSVQDGDVDPTLKTETIRQKIRDEFIADATVTVVLVGASTWQRKHVDWEIGSSIRATANNPRCGLLGVLLPTFPGTVNSYRHCTLPPRLYDNLEVGFAKLYAYPQHTDLLLEWIHEAFERRDQTPDNSRPQFKKNWSGVGWC